MASWKGSGAISLTWTCFQLACAGRQESLFNIDQSCHSDSLSVSLPVMSRRSSRLIVGGYYNSDEESDSSSVTNITYRENPVKWVTVCVTNSLVTFLPLSCHSEFLYFFFRVFKKKAGTRKAASRTPSRVNSNVSSASARSPFTEGQYDVRTIHHVMWSS